MHANLPMHANLIAFTLFAMATAATPGPNNAMLAASGATHGLRRTLPHLLGVCIGFGLMVAAVGLGLAGPLAASPVLHFWLRWVGGAWMLWIAFGIARSAIVTQAPPRPPMTFMGAALFQWVNPKAWLMAIATTATYTIPDQPLLPQVVLLSLLFTVVDFPCSLLWVAIGAGAARVLRSASQLRAFNMAMAALLALSIAPLLVD